MVIMGLTLDVILNTRLLNSNLKTINMIYYLQINSWPVIC